MGLFNSILKVLNNKKEEIKVTTTPAMVVRREVNVPNNIKDDYRKTIFFYAENTATKIRTKKEYVGYLEYECGITNPDIFHKQLIDDGYYEQSSLEDVLKKKSVADIKEILSVNNFVTKGKKEELINYLVENLSYEVIEQITKDYYSLSNKGKEFFDAHQDYVEIHRHKSNYQINLEEYYNATKNDSYKRKFNDVAWQIFNDRTLEYTKKKEYGCLRFNYYHMASLLLSENKKEHALQLYLYCLVMDLSGVESIHSISSYKSGFYDKKKFLESLEYIGFIPSLINEIVGLKEFYNDAMLQEAYSVVYLPFNVSSIDFIRDLLDNAFNSAVFDEGKYKSILIENKKKKYLEMI